jgi:hypothetical protein
MPDLDPAVIESLLYDGAHRRGVTVDAYRDLVQAAADNAGIAFGKALGVVNDFETLPPDKRAAIVETLAFIEEWAARRGVSVERFAEIMLDDHGTGNRPPDTDLYTSKPHAQLFGLVPAACDPAVQKQGRDSSA